MSGFLLSKPCRKTHAAEARQEEQLRDRSDGSTERIRIATKRDFRSVVISGVGPASSQPWSRQDGARFKIGHHRDSLRGAQDERVSGELTAPSILPVSPFTC